jgi:hypothetical protein
MWRLGVRVPSGPPEGHPETGIARHSEAAGNGDDDEDNEKDQQNGPEANRFQEDHLDGGGWSLETIIYPSRIWVEQQLAPADGAVPGFRSPVMKVRILPGAQTAPSM